MRVLHVINNANCSGATRLLIDLLHAQRADLAEAIVYLLEADNPLHGELCAAGAKVVAPARKRSRASHVAACWRLARRHRVEIVHGHLLPASFVALAAAKLGRCASAVTVHFTLDQVPRAGVAGRLVRLLMRRFDFIHAVSNAVKASLLAQCRLDEHCVHVIHGGLDLERIDNALASSDRDATRRTFGLATDDLCIGSVGRLHEVKGFGVLTDAMASVASACPEAKLLIVGDGPEREALQRQTEALGLTGRVVFAHERPNVLGLYRAFDLFVAPSVKEGLGLAALEAMAMGVPVVVSSAGGLPEIVAQAGTGAIVPAGDAGALARAIIGRIKDPAARAEAASAAREAVRRHFDIRRTARAVLECYQQILTRRRGDQTCQRPMMVRR